MKTIKQQLANLPKTPGVYIFKDANQKILYIGKAKNLAARVKSYWQKTQELSPQKQIMVQKITSVNAILAPTETDALILEATLVKQHKPPYNIDLKDDKDWQYIRIHGTEYPIIDTVRRPMNTSGKLFGPYMSGFMVRNMIRMMRNFFDFPSCNIVRNAPCIEYTMGQKIGPAKKGIPKIEYQKSIRLCIEFLQGRHGRLLSTLTSKMQRASKNQQYEKASKFRDQLHAMHSILRRQQIVSAHTHHLDVFTVSQTKHESAINILTIRNGKCIASNNILVRTNDDTTITDIIDHILKQWYLNNYNWPKEIIIPATLPESEKILDSLKKLKRSDTLALHVPEKGWRKRLLDMSQKNADHFLKGQFVSWDAETKRCFLALQELKQALRLPTQIRTLEAYDISNIQGRFAVGSMVRFQDGIPDKNRYRKFQIRTVFQSNDYAMMQEILTRRLKHQDWPLPDLFIIDGGKGQLSASLEVFKLHKIKKPIIGLAKRDEEIFVPKKSKPILLPKTSNALQLLQRIRDEAHRFAITYHRTRRSNSGFSSMLDSIQGLGPKRKKALLQYFGSVKNIKSASKQDLAKIVGTNIAKKLKK